MIHKFFRRVTVSLLVLAMVFTMLPGIGLQTYAATGNWNSYAASAYAAGGGTSGDPYQIATAEQLAYFAAQVNGGNNYSGKYFILTTDLDLSAHYWIPIGYNDKYFSGTFNGNKHVISNLTISISNNTIGLFGANYGTITALGVSSCAITATNGTQVGGFVGNNNGSITNCYVNGGAVNGRATVGGFVGLNAGTITNCYAYVGLYSNGTPQDQFGGFAGNNNGYSSIAKLINCFAAGTVPNISLSGGLVGYASKQNNPNCQITNCYYVSVPTGAVNGIGYDGGSYTVTQKTLAALKALSFYTTSLPTWDFTSTWALNPAVNGGLPNFGSWSAQLPGSGTLADPYLVSTFADLEMIRTNNDMYDGFSGKYLKQTADIAMSGTWTPIGDSTNFKGSYDGNGKTISGLTNTGGSTGYLGLFSYTSSTAVLSNITLTGVNINTSGSYVGGLAGYNAGGSITGCSVSGTIVGGGYVGGLAGYGYGTLQKCRVTGMVNGGGTGGGLIGQVSSNTTITDCYSTASVQTATISGGLVGRTDGSTTIKNSYAAGTVTGTGGSGTYYGGLVGFRSTSYNLNLYNCFFAGFMGNYSWGGIVGNNSAATSSGCYYISGQAAGSLGSTVSDIVAFKSKWFYNATSGNWNGSYPWDFSTTWALDPNVNYGLPFIGTATVPAFSGGTGTSGDPYLIATAADLAAMRTYNAAQGGFSGKYFKQTAHIALSGTWTPIGSSPYCPFRASYDGSGKTISGLTNTGGSAGFLGLFAYTTSTAALSNINLTGVNIITSGNSVGGLVVYNAGGSITGCSVSGTIAGSGYNGGLVGYGYGTLQRCRVTGIVGGSTGGGLIGQANSSTTITDCYSTASVQAATISGGLVGRTDAVVTIKNSYAANGVTGTGGTGTYYGGLVGYRNTSYSLSIYNSFFAGAMGNYSWAGIVGNNTAIVSNCYYQSGYASGSYGTAKALTWFTTASTYATASNWNTTSATLWDFTNTWRMDAGVNNGLPYFRIPALAAASDQGLSEAALNGRTLTLTLTDETFKNTEISPANILLNNKPSGLTVASVMRNSTTSATVTLAYDGTDFDGNVTNFSVTVLGAELTAGSSLTSGLMSVTAVNDYESISLSDNHDISTGDEDGKVITVTLTGGTFANTLTPANWTVTNLPAGVTKGAVTRTDATHVAITLLGNATVSYNNNITNVTVSCTAAEYADSTGGASLTAGSGVTLTGALALPFLTVQSPVIPEAAANNGSVTATQTITLTQGTFNGTDGQPLAGVTFNNLPEGLTATATQVSSTGLRIAFTGNATQHNADNSISNVSVTVAKTSITGAFGATASGNFEISFMNPAYISVQNPFVNERQTDYASGAIDETQTITVTNGTFDDSITNGGVTVNSLPEGLCISVTKNSPTQITIAFTGTAANHANANDVNGATVTVAADKIIGAHAALNTNTFKINFDDPEPVIAASEPLMKETAANNGTVGGTQTLTIFYGEFAEGIAAGDITVGSLPSGLGIGEVTRSADGTQITFALTGTATAHEIANSVTNAAFSVSESAIVPTGSTALTAPVASSTFEIRFMDAYPVYTITFHENGGPDVSDQTVVFGNTVSRPEAASRAHHTFGGWYQDEALSAPWNFETDIVSKNTALYAMWTQDPKYTVTVNCGANGTVVSDPVVATVYKGETVTFTIMPAKGYKIASLKFNGADVAVNSSGQYTTTALTANVGLAVTFEEKVLTAPTILTVAPAHIGSQTLTVTDEEGNPIEKTINSSFICYATVSNPDDRTIVGYGMLLKDVATGKVIELPVVRSMFNGQFAVRVYGGGFVAGQKYSLQAYVKYVDKNSVTQTVLESQTNLFTWE